MLPTKINMPEKKCIFWAFLDIIWEFWYIAYGRLEDLICFQETPG